MKNDETKWKKNYMYLTRGQVCETNVHADTQFALSRTI